MSELRELYQEIILDHNRSPRNRRVIPDADAHSEGHNPLCGDQVTVYLKMKDGVVEEASFEGHGCAISTASASLMTEAVVGKTAEEADRMFEEFRDAVTLDEVELPEGETFEKLQALAGVKEFPMRVKCATLPWHTLHAALHNEQKVSTE